MLQRVPTPVSLQPSGGFRRGYDDPLESLRAVLTDRHRYASETIARNVGKRVVRTRFDFLESIGKVNSGRNSGQAQVSRFVRIACDISIGPPAVQGFRDENDLCSR